MPTQLELACLRSLNTEGQERLFGQARVIAEACTNQHPDNVIPQIMLRLQAKQEQHEFLTSVKNGDSQVSHVAKDLPQIPGTRVKTSFIKGKEDSWQVHLQRISPFLVAGEDIWWSSVPNGFIFHDGDTDSADPSDDFSLMHHRYHSLMDVENRRDACWKKMIDQKTVIPALNADGNKTGRLLYKDNNVELECIDEVGTSITETEGDHDPETPAGAPTSECEAPPEPQQEHPHQNVKLHSTTQKPQQEHPHLILQYVMLIHLPWYISSHA